MTHYKSKIILLEPDLVGISQSVNHLVLPLTNDSKKVQTNHFTVPSTEKNYL